MVRIARSIAKQLNADIIELTMGVDKNVLFNKYQTASPEEFVGLMHSAADPIIWCDFLIESNRVSETIVQEMRKIPSVDVRNTILVYPHKKSRSLRHEALRKIVAEAGLL